MTDVTHAPIGFTGTVDQTGEAQRFQGVAVPFRCIKATDWQVTVAAGNRTVQIAAGSGYVYGVRDATSSIATLTSAANATGSTRLDVVVASYNWATTSTSFFIIQGTTTLPAINTGGVAIAGQINRIPGVQYDAVAAVLEVRNGVGAFLTTDVFEIRPYGGISGYLTIATSKYLTTVDVGGIGQVRTANTGANWLCTNGSTWTRQPVTNQVFASLTARDAYFAGVMAPVAGDRCVCLSSEMVHDGTAWRFTLYGIGAGTTDANGYYVFPHGGGQTPQSWLVAMTAQTTDALSIVSRVLAWNFDGTNLTVRGTRSDSSAYLSTNTVNFHWEAKF